MKEYSDKEMNGSNDRDKKTLMSLGDLSPLISMYKSYEKMTETQKKRFHDQYQISEKEIQMLYSKKLELEK